MRGGPDIQPHFSDSENPFGRVLPRGVRQTQFHLAGSGALT